MSIAHTTGPWEICFPPPKPKKDSPPFVPNPICFRIRPRLLELSTPAGAELDLDPRLAEVSILLSVYALAHQLSDHELRRVILSKVSRGIADFAAQLPQNVELKFNGRAFSTNQDVTN